MLMKLDYQDWWWKVIDYDMHLGKDVRIVQNIESVFWKYKNTEQIFI